MEENIDLSVFEEKMPWKERAKLIERKIPSTNSLDWYKVFRSDPAILGRIVNDVIKQEQARPGTPGKRPSLDPEVASQKMSEMSGDDYTILPFAVAFTNLKGNRSIRNLAAKVNLDKSIVHRLLQGKIEPTLEQMEAIATGFKKKPGYFHEYRVSYVVSMMAALMDDAPESGIVQYRRITAIESGY